MASQSRKSQSGKSRGPRRLPVQPPSRIAGGGEMAGLVRAFDWSGTPVGPIEDWPDTLVTTVNLLLASRHPMFLWWGPELIQFYNDGYRPSLRADKHPSALGQRGADCWPEIWPIIGPQIEAVMTKGTSTWNINQLVPINRNGKLEEIFWTYGYSPVRDKNGTVKGTLVVCSETTEQVVSERRLRTLLAITAEASPAQEGGESQPLLPFAQSLIETIDRGPEDIPFAALYLFSGGEAVLAGRTSAIGDLAAPRHWPLAETAASRAPRLIENLQEQFGRIVLPPWPEPVTRAYLLPLEVSPSKMQAVLLLGISPRLPFDRSYQTFFQLAGARIGGLLQSEIHQRERASAALRFRRLTEANPFGMVIGSLHGEIYYVNPAFLRTLGYTEEELNTGKVRWDDLTPPEYAEADARAVQQLRATGSCEVYEKAYVAKDGRRVPILLGASVIERSAKETDVEVAAFVTDLTPLRVAQEELRRANDELEKKVVERTAALEAEVFDRKRAEVSLRQLTGRLLRSQDEERRHMARELHDHAGQTLTVLALNLAALSNAVKGKDSKILDLISDSKQLSDDLSKEIRTLSHLLHPPLLDEIGILSALRWYVDGFSQRSKIAVELDWPGDLGRLPRELELVIFRVVQESLTNVHRHSGSPTARIELRRSENGVTFEVSDQGKGIAPERQSALAGAKLGVGVRGMEERVRQLGGTLRIISRPNETRVLVTLPIVPEN